MTDSTGEQVDARPEREALRELLLAATAAVPHVTQVRAARPGPRAAFGANVRVLADSVAYEVGIEVADGAQAHLVAAAVADAATAVLAQHAPGLRTRLAVRVLQVS